MGLDFAYIPGQTPLDEDEKDGLLIDTISTRSELDEFEQKNVEEAVQWMFQTRRFKLEEVLTEKFVTDLHRRMYGKVWSWAGQFRRTNKNIGVDKWQIPTEFRYLLDNTRYWIEHGTFSNDETVIRFKHRLVNIHCFPNGNGRHSRLMGDIVNEKLFKGQPFSWGSANIVQHGDTRKAYLQAIWAADKGDFVPLLRFARS